MKTSSHLRSLFILVSLAFLLSHCSSKNDVMPVNAADVVGKWQAKSLNFQVNLKKGAPRTLTGATDEIIEFKNDGTVETDNFLYGILFFLYGDYSLNGNELTLENSADELAYFTVSITGSNMTWKMNREQGLRASKNSAATISMLDAVPADFDNIQGMNMTIEFVKK